MFNLAKKALAGAVLALGATVAQADVTITVSSWLPPSHAIVSGIVTPWAKQIEEASGGEIKVRILPKPLGSPPAHFDIARDGLADVTYGVHGYQPGRFLLTSAAELPFLGESSEAISVAYWRAYNKYAMGANEHDGVKVLALFTHGPGGMLSTGDAIDEISDLDGMKIRIGGGVVAEMSKNLGVVGLLKPAPEVYEILSRGVADGVFFPMESIKAFKLEKIVKNVTTFPGGFYNTSFFMVMNQDKYNGLSDEHKAIIDAASGEPLVKIAGQAWDAADDASREVAIAAGINIAPASDQFLADVAAKVKPVETDWIARASEAGVDAEAMIAELRAIASELMN